MCPTLAGTFQGTFDGGHNGTFTTNLTLMNTTLTGNATISVNDIGSCSNAPQQLCLEDFHCPGGTCVKPFVFQTDVSGESTCDGVVTFGVLTFGTFTGTVSGDCASGTWSGVDATSGTWMGCRVP